MIRIDSLPRDQSEYFMLSIWLNESSRFEDRDQQLRKVEFWIDVPIIIEYRKTHRNLENIVMEIILNYCSRYKDQELNQ